MEINLLLIGAGVGLLVGLTGVGGASLLMPLLLMLGIQPAVAVATDLFYNAVTKLFGSIQHLRQRTVDLTLVLHFAAGSIPGAAIMILALKLYPPLHRYQDTIITNALGIVLIFVALFTIAKLWFFDQHSNSIQAKSHVQKRWLTIGIGAVLGITVGLTSVGSGSLFALAMMLFYRLKASVLVGTDIVHAFLLLSAASFIHAGIGQINYSLAFNLLLGSIPAVMLGSRIAFLFPSKPLRTVVAGIILISGIKLL